MYVGTPDGHVLLYVIEKQKSSDGKTTFVSLYLHLLQVSCLYHAYIMLISPLYHPNIILISSLYHSYILCLPYHLIALYLYHQKILLCV